MTMSFYIVLIKFSLRLDQGLIEANELVGVLRVSDYSLELDDACIIQDKCCFGIVVVFKLCVDASIIGSHGAVFDFEPVTASSRVELGVAVLIYLVFVQRVVELLHSKTAVIGFEDHSIQSHGAEHGIVGIENCSLFIVDSFDD